MQNESSSWSHQHHRYIFIPLLIGILYGLIFSSVIVYFGPIYWNGIWKPLITYNNISAIIAILQGGLLGPLGCLFAGGLSIRLPERKTIEENHVLFIGAFSGIISGIIVSFILLHLLSLSVSQMYSIIEDPFHLKFLVSHFLPYGWILLLIVVLFALIQASGAYLAFFWSRAERREFGDGFCQENGKKWSKKPITIFIILILLIIIVPLGITYIGIWSGIIKPQSCCADIDRIKIDRLSTDSVKISFLSNNQNPGWILLQKPPSFQILIDSNEYSDENIIRSQGLSDVIDPPEGLEYRDGSLMILKGPGISNQNNPCHIIVIEVLPDGENRILYDSWI